MICKHCQTDNPENAVYCFTCGKRLDGKIVCPHCHSLCPEESVFCNTCGKRIAKDRPAQISAAPNATVPAQTGAKLQENAPARAPRTFTFFENGDLSEKVKRYLDLGSGVFLMAGILFAIAFVLCMGITATIRIPELNYSESRTRMIWYFFGGVYKDIRAAIEATGVHGEDEYTMGYVNYFPAVLSTIVCVSTLVCVFVSAIVAAIRYVNTFKNPNANHPADQSLNYRTPAVTAILSFVMGATLLYALNSEITSPTYVPVSFSTPTVAGIALCASFLGLNFLARNVRLGKEFITKYNLVNFVCRLTLVVFLCLVAAFAAAPAIKVSQGEVSLNLNIMSSFELLSEDGKYRNGISAWCSLGNLMQIVVIVMTFALLIKQIATFEVKNKHYQKSMIAQFVLTCVYFVLVCLAAYLNSAESPELLRVTAALSAATIVTLVFSALSLACSVTYKILCDRIETDLQLSDFHGY